jgi:hypothetical protein
MTNEMSEHDPIMTPEQLEASMEMRKRVIEELTKLLNLTPAQRHQAYLSLVYGWYKTHQPRVARRSNAQNPRRFRQKDGDHHRATQEERDQVVMATNITEEHQAMFAGVREADNIALFSCFINDEPGCAIVSVNREGDLFEITPLFVSVTPSMKLVDHEGAKI